jgi:hypothetical protein
MAGEAPLAGIVSTWARSCLRVRRLDHVPLDGVAAMSIAASLSTRSSRNTAPRRRPGRWINEAACRRGDTGGEAAAGHRQDETMNPIRAFFTAPV